MNDKIMILLYLIVVVFLLIQIYDMYNVEHFSTTNIVKNDNINSLILSPYTSSNNTTKYFGTFIASSNNNILTNGTNFYETNSLDDNKWDKSTIVKIDKSIPNIIINNILYNEFKEMLVVGLYYKNNKPIYNIYKQTNLSSNTTKNELLYEGWKKIGSDTNIQSICFDLMTSKLLGVSSFDGQIYEKNVDTQSYNKEDWIGPINNDIPMSKIMYDKDNNMIGIGLFDNYIYTKEGVNWRTEYWDKKKINKTKVYDLMYDYDGCLIASSSNGILKQLKPELSSEFINIRDYTKNKNDIILSKYDILKSKIGYEYLDDIFDTGTPLGRHLKNIYDIKKLTKDMCYNKSLLRGKDVKDSTTDDLSFKNREINDLYKQIDKINQRLSE